MALNDVPKAYQKIKDTQLPIQNNFLTIGAGFAADHSPFVIPFGGDEGKHEQVTFISGAAKTFDVSKNEFGLFNQSSVETLYLANATGLSQQNIPICGTQASLQASNGWTYLPSGVFIQWFTKQITTTQLSTPYNYGVVFPNACLSVTGTAIQPINDIAAAISPLVTALNTTTALDLKTSFYAAFANESTIGPITFSFVAIGY